MAEFKVGIEGDASGLNKALKESTGNLDKFSSDLDKAKKSLAGNVKEAEYLESEIKKLGVANKNGTIAAENFAKTNTELKQRLSDVRANISFYQKSISDLKIKQDALTKSTQVNTVAIDKNTDAAIRHVAANKNALSAANNLTRSLATIAAGGTGAAGGIGVFVRQLASLSATSVGLSGTLSLISSSLMGPAGIGIAISVVTSAITTYISNVKSAKEETKTLAEQTQELISKLDSLTATRLKGEQSSIKEINSLKRLYDAAKNNRLSTEERTKAAKLLQQTYPDTFKNFSKEEIMLGKAATGYDNLTTAIIATAKAKAASDRIAENSIKVLENETALKSKQNDLDKTNNRLAKIKEKLREEGIIIAPRGGPFGETEQEKLVARRNKLESEILALRAQNIPLLGSNMVLEKEIAKAIESQGVAVLGVTEKQEKKEKKQKEAIRDMSELVSITKNLSTYIDSYNQALKAQEEITRKKKEEFDLWFKIDQLVSGDKLESKLQKDLKSLNDAYDQLKKNAPKDVTTQAGLSMRQRLDQTKLEAKAVAEGNKEANEKLLKENEEAMKALTAGLKRATNTFVNDFMNGLMNIRGGFDGVFNGMLDSFKSLFVNQISNQLQKVFEKNITNLGTKSSNIVSGIGLLGGVISGASKSTSFVGKGVGGALSGAAIGTMLAPGIGTAIGAVFGGLSGILGAGKARKEEKRIQEEQLRVQKEQLEQQRKAAQAFSAAIIGQMTNQGIVTSVDRNEFGQIIGKVSGSDILLVTERAEKERV